MRSISHIIFIICLLIQAAQLSADERIRAVTHFENSDHELTIYFIESEEKGNTMMIIGGIQGDEPGGYLAADLYADMLLKKGNLIVVPRANFYTIRKNKRGASGDMNRKFGPGQPTGDDFDDTIVEVLKGLISQSDVLLNLHEGSGFYYPEYISEIRNPRRYGQSIIADADISNDANGETFKLKEPAMNVIHEINRNITNPDHHFHFNNHDTRSEQSSHKEQRKSATYYAMTVAGIPAFGLEISKSIQSIETKVYYQTLAINAFMKEYGIIPEHPSISLPPPELDHLVVNIIGNPMPFAVKNGTTLTVPAGSSIQVTSIMANYKRGLSLDILGLGNSSDLGRVAKLNSPTKISVYKDAFPCGEVFIELMKDTRNSLQNAVRISSPPDLQHIEVNVAGKNVVVSSGDTLHIIRGDVMNISGASVVGADYTDIRINFVGFVGNPVANDGDDRGYYINTAKSLLKRFSLNKKGTLYGIETLYQKDVIGTVYLRIHEPEIEYLIVEREDGTTLALSPGSVMNCEIDEKIKLITVISNIQADPFVETYMQNGNGVLKEVLLPSVLETTEGFDLRFRRASITLATIFFRVRG